MQTGTLAALGWPFRKQTTITADRTLGTQELSGLVLVDSTLGPVTLTLPPLNTIGLGGFYNIIAQTGLANPVTVITPNETYVLSTDSANLTAVKREGAWLIKTFQHLETVAWSWSSLLAGAGTDYFAGGYLFGATDSNFVAPVTHGTANTAYGAHAFIVTGAVPANDVTIQVSGTGIDDDGVRVPAATADIVIPADTPVDTYIETPGKWLGQTTFTHTAGPATTCNYGYAKYWDRDNRDFSLRGVEVTGEAFLTDAAVDLQIIHHRPTGWTFNVGAAPTPPAAIASLATDYGVDVGIVAGEQFAWKRTNLNTLIEGGADEGIIFAGINSVANSIRSATVHLTFFDVDA